jgi:TolA-binding protein
MTETPQLTVFAITVVGIGLTILAFFIREGVITSSVYKQGVKLYQDKNYSEAEAAFRQVIARHPSNDLARLLLGDTLLQQSRVEEAIATWQELTIRAPKNVDAHLRLGMALLKCNRLEAIASLETAKNLFQSQRNPQKAQTVAQLLQEISQQQSLT